MIPTSLKPLSLLIPSAAYITYQHYQLPSPIHATTILPRTLQQSPLHRHYINPTSLPSVDSSHSITIPRPYDPRSRSYLSDAEILSRFTLGVWSGWTFGVERAVLRFLRPKALSVRLDVSGVGDRSEDETPAGKDDRAQEAIDGTAIWTIGQLEKIMSAPAPTTRTPEGSKDEPSSRSALPARGTILFGAFKVADVTSITTSSPSPPSTTATTSIDFVYGANDSWIRGMHRFEVISSSSSTSTTVESSGSNEAQGEEGQAGEVTIRFSSASVRPQAVLPSSDGSSPINSGSEPRPEILGGRFLGPPLAAFHNVYAALLFRDGVHRVLSG